MILSIDETQDGTLADNHIYYAKAVMKFGSKLTQGTVVSVSQSVSSNKNLFCFCQKKGATFFIYHVLDLVVSLINDAWNIRCRIKAPFGSS